MNLRRIALILVCMLYLMGTSLAQYGTSTRGKDFWLGFMKNNDASASESLSLFITSDQLASGTVEVPGQSWSQNFVVSPNVTTTITIPNSIAEVLTSQFVEAKGVHVFSDQPISVYAINFETNTADASKILPTATLGSEYIVSSYAGTSGHESELLIVATEDNTLINIVPSVLTEAGDPAGVSIQLQLDMGECYQMKASANGDLTGTSITANITSGSCRPFAVFSGAGCSSIPSDCFACDHIYEQNFPVALWGTEYYVTPWVFELSPDWPVSEPNYTYRIIAMQNGTSILIDGVAAFNLNAGEYQEFNHETIAHCLNANNKIAVVQYMEGIECGGNGDPSMVILDDISKKVDEVTFSTVESSVITSHYLNLIIDTQDLGTVLLDGSPIAASDFQSFSFCANQLWCGIEITAGSHTLSSSGNGVTGYVYGNGPNESYAYSVGSFYEEPPIEFEDITCTMNEVQLQINPTYTNVEWFAFSDTTTIISTDQNYIISPPIENELYIAKCVSVVSGCETTFYYSVESPAPIGLTLQPASITICEHQDVSLNAMTSPSSGFYLYEWTSPESLNDPTIANPIASPVATTTYNVTVKTPGECAVATGSIEVIVNSSSIAQFSASPEIEMLCAGESADLHVDVQTEIWSDDFDPNISLGDWEDIISGEASAVCGSVSDVGLYFNGVYPRQAITVPMDVSAGGTIYFSLKVANESAPCDDAEVGDNIQLAYSVNSGPWTLIETLYESSYPDFVELAVAIPAAALSNNTQFRWRQVGSYLPNQDNWVLDNVYVGVNDTENYSFNWTPAASLNDNTAVDPIATPTAATTYVVQMTNAVNGCLYSDSVHVEVGESFTLDMTPTISICDAEGIQLYATPSEAGEYSYQWTPQTNITGIFGATPTVNPESTTTYQVEVTSQEGCTATGEVIVNISSLLDLTLSATDSDICEEETIQLSAAIVGDTDGLSYQWSPSLGLSNSQIATTNATPLNDVTYSCVVTHDATGCTLTDEISITVTPAFEVIISPDEISTCVLSGMNVEGSSDYNGLLSWSWSPANMVNESNVSSTTLTGNTDGLLTLTATTESGCSSETVIEVVQQLLETDLGPDTGICEDETITLDSGWPEDYDIEWNTFETSSAITVNASGVYHVSVTSPEGCTSEDEIAITVFSYPVIELGNDTALCEGEALHLEAGVSGLHYLWSTGQVLESIDVTTAGIYSLTVDNTYCFSTDNIQVSVNEMPVKPFDDLMVHCFSLEPSLLLNARNDGATYIWSNDSTSKFIEATSAGAYSVLVTTEQNCSSVFDLEITEDCPVSLFVPNSFTPDGDGLNDVWKVEGVNIQNFHLRLYNRWGELIFENFDMDKPWLGQRHDGDYYLEPGVYNYLIIYQVITSNGALSEELKMKGNVTMLR